MIARKIGREIRRWRRRGTRDRLPAEGPPVALGKDPVEVHTLVCARDARMSLWSLRSFVAFSGLSPSVVVHDDGSLTDEHRRLYERHFDPIVVLDDREASARMDAALEPWPACRRFRQRPVAYCSRKLLDPLFLARSDMVLLLDSDVLFFRRPGTLLEHLATGSACFSSDSQDAYSMSRADLERWSGGRVHTRLNAGILGVPVAAYKDRLDRIEDFLAHAEREPATADVNVHEQTAHALLMSELDAARLPPDYQLQGPLSERTTSYHFIGEGVGRKRFWDEGVTRVERALA